MNKMIIIAVSLFLGISTIVTHASDVEKEKRWADQIVDGLIIGEAVTLDGDGQKFLGIYAEQTTPKAKGAVIVMHGIGAHPDWPDIINPVRSELPAMGWTTLSIQMPILANDAKAEDYAPLFAEVPARIKAAIVFLKSKGYDNIALVAHSLGSAMTTSYLAAGNVDDRVSGFVAIGLSAQSNPDPKMDVLGFMEKIKLPMLDIFGAQDLEGVVKFADKRAAAARKAGNPDYRQDEVPGANHFFQGLNPDLVRRVRSWLDAHAKTPPKPKTP